MSVQQQRPFIFDAAALASFLLITLIFLWKSVLGQGVVASADLVLLFYPYKAYVRELLAQGELPLWNPLVYLGAPLLANIQAGILYPPNVLFALFSFPSALTWSVLLHVWWAQTGMYLFLRHGLGASVFAAWIGALCFGVGGFLLPHLGQLNLAHTAVWLPWLLLCARRASVPPAAAWLLLGGIVTAFSFTAGHIQEFYYAFTAVVLFCVYLSFAPPAEQSSRWWPLLVPALFLLIGGILSAAQLLPTLEAIAHSQASTAPALPDPAAAVSPQDVVSALLPRYWAAPGVAAVGYIGAGGALLAFFGAVQIARQRWVAFFLLLAVFGLILSLGAETPFFALPHAVMPGAAAFDAAGPWLLLVSFGLAALAALGADRLRDDLPPVDRRRLSLALLFGTVATLLVLLALMGRMYLAGSEQSLPEPTVVVLWSTIGFIVFAAILLVLNHGMANIWAYLLVGGIIVVELFFASRPLALNQAMPPEIYTPAATTRQLAQLWGDARYVSIAAERFPLEDEAARRQPFARHCDLPGEVQAQAEGTVVALLAVDGAGEAHPRQHAGHLRQLLQPLCQGAGAGYREVHRAEGLVTGVLGVAYPGVTAVVGQGGGHQVAEHAAEHGEHQHHGERRHDDGGAGQQRAALVACHVAQGDAPQPHASPTRSEGIAPRRA